MDALVETLCRPKYYKFEVIIEAYSKKKLINYSCMTRSKCSSNEIIMMWQKKDRKTSKNGIWKEGTFNSRHRKCSTTNTHDNGRGFVRMRYPGAPLAHVGRVRDKIERRLRTAPKFRRKFIGSSSSRVSRANRQLSRHVSWQSLYLNSCSTDSRAGEMDWIWALEAYMLSIRSLKYIKIA